MAGGIRAKREGQAFENAFTRACSRHKITCTQMPMGCRRIGPRPRDLIPVKTAFDFILSFEGESALIDTKSIAGSSFAPSQITQHQLNELLNHEAQGITAGYVIWFRKIDTVAFVPASLLQLCITGSVKLNSEAFDQMTRLGSCFSFDPRKIFPRQS